MNKGKKKGQVPLQKHCARCGGRESHLASYHSGPQVPSSLQFPKQHSASLSQPPEPGPRQQVPSGLQGSPLQHGSPAAQEPPASRQKKQTRVLEDVNRVQILLQHSLSAVQVASSGRHIGVVVEVVLVEVEVVLVVVLVVVGL